MPVAFAIYAFRPSAALIDLVRGLSGGGQTIVVVDDGSGPEFRAIFAGVSAGADVLRHAVKRGRNAALQTAINQLLCTAPDISGVVAADSETLNADAILQTAAELEKHTGRVILGPGKGLRGIPAGMLPRLLQVPDDEVEPVLARAARSAETSLGAAGTSARATSAVFALVFAALVGVEIHGFRTTHVLAEDIWYPIGLRRFIRYIAEFVAFAVPLLAMFPWTFGGFITLLVLFLTAVSVGPVALLATVFFLLSSCALGGLLLGRTKTQSITADLCAMLLGTGVYVFLMTFLARVSVNYPAVWAVLLAIPIATDLRHAGGRLVRWASGIRSVELRPAAERISFGLLVLVLGAQWFVAMLPEVSADGLAMHLAIPMNIAANHRMTFEPARYLWSVMPMGTDWLYSIVYLLGGEYAARILNFAMLLTIVTLLYQVVRRWVTPATGFLLAASLAATPVVQFVTGSLFVENYLVALVLAMVTGIWLFHDTGERRFLYFAMVAGGTAMATKYGALVFVVLALPFAAIETGRLWRMPGARLGPNPVRVCAAALGLLLATGLPTYAIAYAKTGNPIFPFLNNRMHSPLLNPAVVIADARFHIPVDWSSLYNLTFHTSKAYEGQDGSFGFQYLVIVPLVLLGLLVVRRGPILAATVLSLAGGLLIMQSTPNVRYLYTAMPLLLIAMAGLLGWLSSHQRWIYSALILYLYLCTGLNTYFLASSSYYHKDFCPQRPFSRADRERYLEEAAPVRSVVAYYNQHHPNSVVLLTSSTAHAGINGEVFMNNWHQFPVVEQLRGAQTPLDMFHLMQQWKVGYFIEEQLAPGDQLPGGLEPLLSACTVPEYKAGGFTLARLSPDCTPPPPAGPLHDVDPATQTPVGAGTYDDLDAAIIFHGDWAHDKSFDNPYKHTISYTDTPGTKAFISFEGTGLTYVFTKAPNRGIASVTIDGGTAHTVDLYSPNAEWQTRQTFCCFTPGRHHAVLEVTGQANPKSAGRFVDLDAFVVQ